MSFKMEACFVAVSVIKGWLFEKIFLIAVTYLICCFKGNSLAVCLCIMCEILEVLSPPSLQCENS